MPKVAVVDDIVSEGQDLAKLLNRKIGPTWRSMYAAPLDDASEYPAWVAENDVWALVLDWKLNGVGRKPGEKGVDYTAERVKQAMRHVLPDYPIYVITTQKDQTAAAEWLADVETFGSRTKFVEDLDVIAPRIMRATARFRNAHQESLALISRLAAKAAQGGLTGEERAELDAARATVRMDTLSFPEPVINVVVEADELRVEIDTILEALKSKIGDRNK